MRLGILQRPRRHSRKEEGIQLFVPVYKKLYICLVAIRESCQVRDRAEQM
jgi:hypothetical protein